jgi:hypothetical protein
MLILIMVLFDLCSVVSLFLKINPMSLNLKHYMLVIKVCEGMSISS